MNQQTKDRFVIVTYVALITLALVYLAAKPLIILLELCSFFGSYCKFFTGLLYNTFVYWLLAAGFLFSTSRLIIAEFKKRRYLRNFQTYKYNNEKLNRIICSLGHRFTIKISPEKKVKAFSTGIIKKALYLSRGAIDSLDENKLKALVYHEEAHIKNNDVLHLSIARLASDLFFYLPGLKAVRDRLETEKEYAADQNAAKRLGSNRFVIDALLRITQLRLMENQLIASFSSGKSDVLKRINKLQGKEVNHNISQAALVVSLIAILFIGILAINASASVVDSGCLMHMPIKLQHLCLL